MILPKNPLFVAPTHIYLKKVEFISVFESENLYPNCYKYSNPYKFIFKLLNFQLPGPQMKNIWMWDPLPQGKWSFTNIFVFSQIKVVFSKCIQIFANKLRFPQVSLYYRWYLSRPSAINFKSLYFPVSTYISPLKPRKSSRKSNFPPYFSTRRHFSPFDQPNRNLYVKATRE